MTNGHGDDLYHYHRPITSNFSSNVFYAADTSGLKAHLRQRMDSIDNYPEPEPYTLERAWAMHYQIPAACVSAVNGATEGIYLIAQTFRGVSSAILSPTFSEYADACRMNGHRVSSLYNLENIPEHVQMVWICNPNNPTGTVLEKEYLLAVIRRHPHICFVVDRAYGDFTLKEVLAPADTLELPNVFQLHSMTKVYAIPGLRLGFVTAAEELLEEVRLRRMPWSVNQLAIEAGLYILREGIPHRIGMSSYLQECARLRQLLEATGAVEVWPTDTHFMLARLRMGTAPALKDYLANEHGILIRDASNFEGLNKEYFRVSGQCPEENNKLVTSIEKWFTL